MCLFIDEKIDEKIRKMFEKKDVIRFWKAVCCRDGSHLSAPHMTQHYYRGLNESTRSMDGFTRWEERIGTVYSGFHVFLKKRHAKAYLRSITKVIPVWCKKEDFVAGGYTEYGYHFFSHKAKDFHTAVFTKMTIEEKDYDEIIKKYRRQKCFHGYM